MDENCTVFKAAGFIGKRWTLNILLELYKGSNRRKRYNELKASLPGITPKILSIRLKELSKNGLVKKNTDASSFPVKCEYSLTASGKDFINTIKCMKSWALKWKFKNEECQSRDCEDCPK